MIFDTGSSWVWVGHELCTTCANPDHFNSRKSRTFKQVSPRLTPLHYGRGEVLGYDTRDQVCLNEDNTLENGCMSDYLFRTVVWEKDLEGLAGAGLIGLAPSNQGAGAQLFVPSLYKQGAIKKNMFSMFIDPNETSKIQIGGYDLKKYAKGPINWYKINSQAFWELTFDHVKIGNMNFKPSVNSIMADTGTSLNMIPD